MTLLEEEDVFDYYFTAHQETRVLEEKESEECGPDGYLFLFGFVFFPLWWCSAWRGCMGPGGAPSGNVYQQLSCVFSLFSLLVLGLAFGLWLSSDHPLPSWSTGGSSV
ncbi:hypothetical protein BY458DRAFT_500898, partial [Sporodiniella umbellata]